MKLSGKLVLGAILVLILISFGVAVGTVWIHAEEYVEYYNKEVSDDKYTRAAIGKQ